MLGERLRKLAEVSDRSEVEVRAGVVVNLGDYETLRVSYRFGTTCRTDMAEEVMTEIENNIINKLREKYEVIKNGKKPEPELEIEKEEVKEEVKEEPKPEPKKKRRKTNKKKEEPTPKPEPKPEPEEETEDLEIENIEEKEEEIEEPEGIEIEEIEL